MQTTQPTGFAPTLNGLGFSNPMAPNKTPGYQLNPNMQVVLSNLPVDSIRFKAALLRLWQIGKGTFANPTQGPTAAKTFEVRDSHAVKAAMQQLYKVDRPAYETLVAYIGSPEARIDAVDAVINGLEIVDEHGNRVVKLVPVEVVKAIYDITPAWSEAMKLVYTFKKKTGDRSYIPLKETLNGLVKEDERTHGLQHAIQPWLSSLDGKSVGKAIECGLHLDRLCQISGFSLGNLTKMVSKIDDVTANTRTNSSFENMVSNGRELVGAGAGNPNFGNKPIVQG